MVAKGDQRVLSKDVMITQEFAERELVAKGSSKSRTEQGGCRQEEEEMVVPPPAAVDDGGKASEDDDDGVFMSSNTPPSACNVNIPGRA